MVLSLFVQVIQLKGYLVDGSTHCDLLRTSSVKVQFCVYFIKDLFKTVSFGNLHHVSVDELERVLNCLRVNLLVQWWELSDVEGLIRVLILFEEESFFDICVPV